MAWYDPVRRLFVPRRGETTKQQVHETGFVGLGAGARSTLAPTGTYQTYRLMRACPTLAMSKAAAFAPIKAAAHSWEEGDGAPPGAVELIQEQLDHRWYRLIKDALLSVEYGWEAMELVWDVDEQGRYILRKIKPLLQDISELQHDEHGEFVGVKQGSVELEADRLFYFVNDQEAGDLYGRSRYENVRLGAWHEWVQLRNKWEMYMTKASGIIPIMRYPQGTSLDSSGSVRQNGELAHAHMARLGAGAGIAIPIELLPWAEDAMMKGAKWQDLMAWSIEFAETHAGLGSELIEGFRYFDSLMCRGFLMPERTITEGQNGTKAEAEAHADVSLAVSDALLGDIVEAINDQIVDRLLVSNFGRKAKGTVRAKASPIVDDQRAFLRGIVTAVLTNPGNADVFFTATNVDQILDDCGIPKAQDIVGPMLQDKGLPELDKDAKPGEKPMDTLMRLAREHGILNGSPA